MSYRTSTGDFEVDTYVNQSGILLGISWIVWVFAVLILHIIFMNFIIAVISESYSKVMQKLQSETFKVKADMIVEREYQMTDADLADTTNFPRYIVVRRPANQSGGDQA